MFFIGNGLTGDTAAGDLGGQVQQFVVPAGATRLFLGTSDGYEWNNNGGAFNVTVAAVPEAAAVLMGLSGVLTVLLAGRRRRGI